MTSAVTFEFSYALMVFFLTLGPIKIIPVFAHLTQGADRPDRRRLALYATLFATVMCVAIALLARTLTARAHRLARADASADRRTDPAHLVTEGDPRPS